MRRLAATVVLLGALVMCPVTAFAATDQYEPDDTMEQAAHLTIGVSQAHNLDADGCEDWMYFDATAGMAYELKVWAGPDYWSGWASAIRLDMYESDASTISPVWIDANYGDLSGRQVFRRTFIAEKAGPTYVRLRQGPNGYDDFIVSVLERQPNVAAGRIGVAPTGTPLVGWVAELHRSNNVGYSEGIVATATTGADGTYRAATALDNEDFVVHFRPPDGGEGRDGWFGERAFQQYSWEFNATCFRFPRAVATTATCNWTSYPFSTVAGTATIVPGGEPADGMRVEFEHYDTRYSRWKTDSVTTSTADGSFGRGSFDPRRSYRYRVVDPGGDYLDELKWHAVPVTAGATTSIEPTVTLGGSIAGIVSDEVSGSGIASATIDVYPFDNLADWAKIGSFSPDSLGRFHIRGLYPGNYCMYVSSPETGHRAEWNGNALSSEGRLPIAVSLGAATPVDVALNPDSVPPVTACVNLTDRTATATVQLLGTDNLSGVRDTFYKLDYSETRTYSDPIEVTGLGSHSIEFWSVDNAGNPEAHKTATVWAWTASSCALTTTNSLAPAYHEFVTIRTRISDPQGWPLSGRKVWFERLDESGWKAIDMEVTDAGGYAYTWLQGLEARQQWRARFADSAPYTASVSESLVFVPKVLLGTVSAKRVGTRKYQMTGTLTPRHRAGTKPVRLIAQRSERGRWVTRMNIYPAMSDTVGGSRYTVTARFPYSGSWRVRAYHPTDRDHSATYSGYKYISVR